MIQTISTVAEYSSIIELPAFSINSDSYGLFGSGRFKSISVSRRNISVRYTFGSLIRIVSLRVIARRYISISRYIRIV